MAFQCYVTIHGHMQGTFQGAGDPGMTQTQHMGSNATQFRAMRPNATQTGANGSNTGWIPVLAFNYEVTAPTQPSGKRQHMPVSFVKEWDTASPQLFQACCNNETLDSVRFEFVDADAQKSHTITLTNATISSIRFDIKGPAPSTAGTTQDLEQVALTFQKIEFATGSKVASDTWDSSKAASDTWTTDSPSVVTAGSPQSSNDPTRSIGKPASNLVGAGAQIAAGAPGQTNVGGPGPPRFAPALATLPIRGRLAGLNRPLQQGAPKTS